MIALNAVPGKIDTSNEMLYNAVERRFVMIV